MHPDTDNIITSVQFCTEDGTPIDGIANIEFTDPPGTKPPFSGFESGTLEIRLTWWSRWRLRRFLRKTQRSIRRKIKKKSRGRTYADQR